MRFTLGNGPHFARFRNEFRIKEKVYKMLNASAQNLGTESAFGVLARAGALSASGKDIINLGIGQPDFRTQSILLKLELKLCKMAHMVTPPRWG